MSVRCNGVLIGNKAYPNNERIFDISEIKSNYYNGTHVFAIDLHYVTDIDLSVLYMLKQWIDDKYSIHQETSLHMNYMPYSRMDREIKEYGFTLKYICKLINSLNFNYVYVFDPHSNVCSGLLDRCISIFPYVEVRKAIDNFDADIILYPDSGAYKKYEETLEIKEIPRIFGFKHRNSYTGQITQYKIPDAEVVEDKKVLIVDDICVKGGTAYHAAKALKEAGAKDVALYISHCEYAIKDGDLLKTDVISKIYTTKSVLQEQIHSKIHFV